MTAFTAWLDLLAMARWADAEDAKRGEVPNVAERFLARRWRWTRGRVRRLLTSLERGGRIVRARDGDGRTPGSVTIVGYDDLTAGSTRPANRPANDQAPGPQEAQRDAGFNDGPARKGDGTRPAPRPKVVKRKEGTTNNTVDSLWAVWIEELGGDPPHPKLSTGKRRDLLARLYSEQLADLDDPVRTFRGICWAVRASSHHMRNRDFQYPESLFRNEERRERWTLKARSSPPAASSSHDPAEARL